MVTGTPRSANEFIEQQLNERATALMEAFGADTLGLSGKLVYGVDDVIRNVVESMRRGGAGHDKLVVLLTTSGGYIEVVHRIVDTLRHHYETIDFIVPNSALLGRSW